MPEGDSVHRAAERLRALEGEDVAVAAPNPRAASLGIAERLDGRRLERVEAVGKNLLLTFEGGLVLRSHLRMHGRWQVRPAGSRLVGRPWLVLRGRALEAVLWHGPVVELTTGEASRARSMRRLGPDIMAEPPDLDGMIRRLRETDQRRELGEALLDQRLVAGIGNIWKAEGLFLARLSPWLRLGDASDGDLRRLLGETASAMRGGGGAKLVYRRAGRPCRRCSGRIEARGQGEDARTAYWCARCQGGTKPAGA